MSLFSGDSFPSLQPSNGRIPAVVFLVLYTSGCISFVGLLCKGNLFFSGVYQLLQSDAILATPTHPQPFSDDCSSTSGDLQLVLPVSILPCLIVARVRGHNSLCFFLLGFKPCVQEAVMVIFRRLVQNPATTTATGHRGSGC